jgi:hypothetical protein
MIGEFVELVDWLFAATAGWRFLFSSQYRRQVLTGWKYERWYHVASDVICGFAGIAFTLTLIVGLWVLVRG